MQSVGVTREQLAKRAGRSVWTLRRWERNGILPKPIPDGVTASYPAGDLIPGRSWSDVRRVIVQGDSIFFVYTDNTCVWRKRRRSQMPEKSLEGVPSGG